MDPQSLRGLLQEIVGGEATECVDATRLATALLGNAIATNLFVVGYAFQQALI